MAMNIVGHAVQRRAALALHRAQHRQRVEALAREDHRGAVRDAAEVADHHAEAVVERHRDAHAVVRRQPQQPRPTKNALFRMLWCVSVAPLGVPVVPDVNWMLIGSSN